MQSGHAISRSRSTLNKSQRRPRIRDGLARSGAVVADFKLLALTAPASPLVGRGSLFGLRQAAARSSGSPSIQVVIASVRQRGAFFAG